MSRRKNPFATFPAILLYSLVVFIAICVIFSAWLTDYLAEYESALPEVLADKVTESFERADADELFDSASNVSDMGREAFRGFIGTILDPNDFFTYAASKSGDNITYDVISKNKKIASFALTKTGELTEHGFPLYSVGAPTYYPQFTYTVTAPAECEVTFNGKTLENAVEISRISPYIEYDGSESATVKYTVDGLNYALEVTAMPPEGMTCNVSRENDDFTVVYVPDPAECDAIREVAKSAIGEYVLFTTKRGTSYLPFLKYVHKDSDLNRQVKLFDNTWSYGYTKDEYNRFELTDFETYAPDKYSCEADVIYTIYRYSGSMDFDFNFKLYFIKDDDTWKLYSLSRVIKK